MLLNTVIKNTSIAAVAALLTSTAVAAQDLYSAVAFQVVELNEEGKEVFIDRTTVKPGETLQYTISHINGTSDDLTNLVVMAPVPNGALFTAETQKTSVDASFEVQAEMDPENEGLEWSTLPATRIVFSDDGSKSVEPLPTAEIKAVRWTLPQLEAGDTALNSYRVTIN